MDRVKKDRRVRQIKINHIDRREFYKQWEAPENLKAHIINGLVNAIINRVIKNIQQEN